MKITGIKLINKFSKIYSEDTKRVISFFLLFCLLIINCNCVFAQQSPENSGEQAGKVLFHGKVEINEDKKKEKEIFTGETQKVEQGTRLKMTVSNVLSSGYNQKDDEFFAEITNDLTVPGGIIIPTGTIAHGKVNTLEGSKRLGRDAYITLHFDYLITPDGRKIPIEASMTTKRNAASSVAKVALEDTAYTVAGGVLGGFLALKYLGIGTAIASNGYTVAGGAGVGALVGATASVVRKGGEVLIAPGDEINVEVKGALNLPVMKEEAFKDEEKTIEGLNVQIVGYRLEKDPFGELNTITLNIMVDNQTNKTFSTFDIALVNDYKAVYYPSLFGDTSLWFVKIKPNTRMIGTLSFAVDNPKRKHWIIFYDSSTRKQLARISVNNAKKRIEKNKPSKASRK